MATDRISGGDPETWSTEAFIQHFRHIHERMPERSFTFVLGAGASASSGIPTGGQLVDRWLNEIKLRDSNGHNLKVEEWATSSNLQIDDFAYQQRAEFYPQVYHRRFRDDLEEGYAYLEDIMKDAEPSLGYSMLAQILAGTRHKITISTNFDNMVADSVLMFTDTFAQICGHESLTGFIRVQPRRPLVAKIHRDLLLGPQNDPYHTALLHEDWARELRRLFSWCTPLFVGYGGNDGSLMNFLDVLPPRSIPGGIFWCYRQGGGIPNSRILRLVARHSGKLVPILDFDVFMTQLADTLDFGLLDHKITEGAARRVQRLREQWDKAKKSVAGRVDISSGGKSRQEASRLARDQMEKVETRRARASDDWWSWELRARAEDDPAKREAIYREALNHLPRSPELACNFALFLNQIRKDYDEAERLYRSARELYPDNAIITGNFAFFLADVRKDYDEAERLFRHALELDPNHATNIRNFAVFLHEIRKDYDEPEALYRRALNLHPDDANITGNFAIFLYEIRKDYDEAERLFRHALSLDPNHTNNIKNFTFFLADIRKYYDEAERLYRRALDLDPDDAIITGNFANFLADVRKDYNEAERLYRRALDLEPDDANNVCNFSGFLLAQGRITEARVISDRAWSLARETPSQEAAEVALYRGLLLSLGGKDDGPALGRLRTLLQAEFVRLSWSFDEVLAGTRDNLSEEDQKLYTALAEAILDPEKVPALEKFSRWKEVAPIPLEEPWPPLVSASG